MILFQSTHPLRGATLAPVYTGRTSRFQSTHPLRGATSSSCPASISALFQSTHPLRGATLRRAAPRLAGQISIHAPLAGCDEIPCTGRLEQGISIHAPLAGCDLPFFPPVRRSTDFNPRTPCGVRPPCARRSPAPERFQSTHPLRGATCPSSCTPGAGAISIHAPLAGCDLPAVPCQGRERHFNPRTPCGVRRAVALYLVAGDAISIHAPLAGCDA